ncbi:hypothetical protein PAECIP111802_04091 [Paenibacillus allorhizosphaerae]|uniref:DUF2071 domain-containing protein n=1 Tax=Paenibacillus allorhizosphaerae TaxID=2849866 RepID=A0ABN7TN17_9BACL|nr:hypothetical protein PAECIP111802_04091 [Paenibacillus allorhizosphaerae]
MPPELPLDTYGGEAWIAVVPFHMSGIRPRFLPPLPGASRFPEINVRTYVTLQGKPGVYFFSLDASHALAVKLARRFYHLPYRLANMRVAVQPGSGEVHYFSSRKGGGAAFEGTYRPISAPFRSSAGSLEYWLTERYCLYTLDGERNVLRCDIDHEPWPLQLAAADISLNTMVPGQWHDLLTDTPPLLHFAKKLDVRIWPILRGNS